MILHNFIFGQIMYDIRWVFDGNYGFTPDPEFYYSREDGLDVEPIINLLSNKQKELEELEINNYIQLKRFTESMLDEIRELSKESDIS